MKNGDWKFLININLNLLVETSPDTFENARTGYATVVLRFKIKQNGEKISLSPKTVELSQLKIMNGDEESVTEQTMLRSMANLNV